MSVVGLVCFLVGFLLFVVGLVFLFLNLIAGDQFGQPSIFPASPFDPNPGPTPNPHVAGKQSGVISFRWSLTHVPQRDPTWQAFLTAMFNEDLGWFFMIDRFLLLRQKPMYLMTMLFWTTAKSNPTSNASGDYLTERV